MVMMDLTDLKARKENKAQQDHLVQLDLKALLGRTDPKVRRVK